MIKMSPVRRREYRAHVLLEQNLHQDPLHQFARWFRDAVQSKTLIPNSMVIATAGSHGLPSGRVVLLKDFDSNGFIFYTHRDSPKSRDLQYRPFAEAVFHWPELERQVRIYGKVARISRPRAVRYFYTRPRRAQIAAVVSSQSRVIQNREELEARFHLAKKRWDGKRIPCPAGWTGYQLRPLRYEFWQGRENRLNDRIRFRKSAKRKWIIERLEP